MYCFELNVPIVPWLEIKQKSLIVELQQVKVCVLFVS